MSTVETDLNLTGTIVAITADMERVDPNEVADTLLQSWDDEQVRQAVRRTLPNYVRHVLASKRSAAMRPRREPAEPSEPSTKWEQVRELHAAGRLMDAMVATESGLRRLADCSIEDLRFAANRCMEMARANEARARQYAAVAVAMSKAGAATPAVLGEDAVREAIDHA